MSSASRVTATPRDALIVAHGAPADPAPQEAVLQALAAATAPHLPAGWRIRGATLAAEGALEQALDGLHDPLIYPFFMAEGFFTGTLLPRRLAEAGITYARQTPPFGVDPALPDLMARVALEAAHEAGITPASSALLVAAHGSKVSRTSADSTHAMVAALGPLTGFNRILAGFVEETPFLADQARALGARHLPALLRAGSRACGGRHPRRDGRGRISRPDPAPHRPARGRAGPDRRCADTGGRGSPRRLIRFR